MINKLRPIFAGRTEDDEKIVVYEGIYRLYIRVGDNNTKLLNIGTTITRWDDHKDGVHIYYVKIESDVWSGKASGTRIDIFEEPNIDL